MYKAWFPLTGRWRGFDEAHVTLNQDGTFLAAPLVGGADPDGRNVNRFFGRWLLLERNLLVATVTSDCART